MRAEIFTHRKSGQDLVRSGNGLPAGRNRSVPVVDDDESVRELMAMVLEAEGCQVLRARQIRQARPGIRAVYVSGFVEHNVLQDEIETSRAGFLAKPFSPVSLLNTVRVALETTV